MLDIQQAVDALPVAVLIIDAAGSVRYGNLPACALLGYPHAALVGLCVEQLLPEALRADHATLRKGFVNTGQLHRMGGTDKPLLIRRADDNEIPVDISLGAMLAGTTNESFNIATLIDRREQQQDHAHLKRRVVAKTEALLVAREEAEHAYAFKTQLMGNFSHELRTPLQIILGYAMMGKVQIDDQPASVIKGYFEKIAQAGQGLERLVDSLMLINRQDTGSAASAVTTIDVAEFVIGVVSPLLPLAKDRNQRIDIGNHSAVLYFTGDITRLGQALENLLDNALRYSPQGAQVILHISDTRLPAPHKTKPPVTAISFQVIDAGCGVPVGERKLIFEPFYQSSRTTTGSCGSGLGLPLCRGIVEHHGGTLTLTPRPEGGSIFEMCLPVQPGATQRGSDPITANDLVAAIAAHAHQACCKSLLMQGHGIAMDTDPAAHADCPLGQWLNGAGQSYSLFPQFRELTEAHRALHALTVQAIQLQGQGRDDEAGEMLERQFPELANHVLGLLKQLHF